MAERPDAGDGHEHLDLRQRSGRGSAVRARLSVLPCDATGGVRDTDLRGEAGTVEKLASVRDDAVPGHATLGERDDHPGADPGDSGGLCAGDDGSSGDGEGRSKYRLPPLGKLDGAQLPHVENRYRQTLGEAAPENPAARLRDRDDLYNSDLAAPLRRLTHASIRELQKIMDMETDGQDHNFTSILRAKVAGASASMSTQTKVDENTLRATLVSKLPELLEILREEQIKLAERRRSSAA